MVYATISCCIALSFLLLCGKIKQGDQVPIFCCAVVLCIFAGCRDISFVPDLSVTYLDRYISYVPYTDYIDILQDYTLGEIKDPIFYFFMKICADISLPYQAFLALVTSFYIGTVAYLIFKHSESPMISFLMFVALPWFQVSFSALRQTMAMGICVLVIHQLLINRKSTMAILLVFIAGLFHSSAWIFFIAIILARLKVEITPKLFLIISIFAVVSALIGVSIFKNLIAVLAWNDNLAAYAESDETLRWTGFIIQVGFAGISYFFYEQVKKRFPAYILLYALMTIGVFFQAYTSVVAEMFRVSLYFSIASICVFPAALLSIKTVSRRTLIYCGSIVLLITYFMVSQKFAAYIPFWN